jgi:hypothetical protein
MWRNIRMYVTEEISSELSLQSSHNLCKWKWIETQLPNGAETVGRYEGMLKVFLASLEYVRIPTKKLNVFVISFLPSNFLPYVASLWFHYILSYLLSLPCFSRFLTLLDESISILLLSLFHLQSGQRGRYVRFEGFTAVTMKNDVFWDVTPCSSYKNWRLGET